MYCLLRVLTLSFVVQAVVAHYCYDDNMTSYECKARDNWCVKYTNATGTYRGCTDVNGFCKDEFTGCLPESETGPDQSWCCCNQDNCNSANQLFSLNLFLIAFFYVVRSMFKFL